MLKIQTLGGFELWDDTNPLPLPATIKARSLLAYLIVHRNRIWPRERLADLFWGDRPDHKARRSLATALWHIRGCLPCQELILSDTQTVQFEPRTDLWLDTEVFASQATRDDLASLQAAIDIYRGDFLEGFYDDWIINERHRLEAVLCEALTRLMIGYETRGGHEAALTTALRLLECDPLREDAHRLAMRVYCRLGQRNAALEQYQYCCQIVQQELDTAPMAETTELYRAILEGHFAIGPAPEIVPVRVSRAQPLALPGRNPLDLIAPIKLVGREQELAFLQRCWQAVGTGWGGKVLIHGEAGVGKSRLVEEFAEQLQQQGICVLWGCCYELERALPYQPLVDALRMVLPTLKPTELAASPAWALVEVARLVPEMSEHYLDLPMSAPIRSDQEQARLFDGVTRFLAQLASHGELVVVLEDLHWASESTLSLIHYLVRHLASRQVLLIGTLRPEAVGWRHPLRTLQQQLNRERLAVHLDLPRLSPAAVEAMVVEMSGAGAAVTPLAKRLYQETEGNPFFLIEIVKALFETEYIRLAGGTWQGDFVQIGDARFPLPAGLSETIQARVYHLSDQVQEALRLAAVLGYEFDFDLLHAVWGQSEEETLKALDVLLRRRLIEERTQTRGRDYIFTHHKIQEVIYNETPRRHRQRAHAQAGLAMERLYGAQTETLVGEIAYHFLKGRQHDEALTEKAIAYLLQAGDRTRALYAHREAIDYYRQALALLKERGEHEPAARTLMKLGLTYHSAFDFGRARQAYEEGFVLWQQAARSRQLTPPPPAPHALRIALLREPVSLNPIEISEVVSLVTMLQLFSGLVEQTPEMDIVPAVARTWEVLEGGRVYVFHLREDARWSDGAPVTAGDFEYTWKKALHPTSKAPFVAGLLQDIKGAKAFRRGVVSDPDQVSVCARDPLTLVVELERPVGNFLHLLAHLAPLPRHAVEAHGEAWMQMGKMITNGPFRPVAWQPGQSLILERNATYRGRSQGNLETLKLCFAADWSARIEMYESDELDILDLGLFQAAQTDWARQRHAAEYISTPGFSSHYVGFDVSRPPFDDRRLRRAFALATDRETLADVALLGYAFPATGGFVPSGVVGHSEGIGLPYDPDRARELLAQAGYPGGRGFPPVEALTLYENAPLLEYLQTQWRENLGIEIHWQIVELATFVARRAQDSPRLFISAWGGRAYPDPDSFLALSFIRLRTRWRDETYDRLVQEARYIADRREQMKLYQQADKILVEEAPIIPLVYGRQHLLVKPWVALLTPTAGQWFWKDIIIKPH